MAILQLNGETIQLNGEDLYLNNDEFEEAEQTGSGRTRRKFNVAFNASWLIGLLSLFNA